MPKARDILKREQKRRQEEREELARLKAMPPAPPSPIAKKRREFFDMILAMKIGEEKTFTRPTLDEETFKVSNGSHRIKRVNQHEFIYLCSCCKHRKLSVGGERVADI